MVEAAEEVENDEFDAVEWAKQTGTINLSQPVPVSLAIETPISDFYKFDFQIAVFNYKSDRILSLFANSLVEWIPCDVVASYDTDTHDEIPLISEHKSLELAIFNPLVRCKHAPGAAITTVGDGYWNEVEAVDNLSLYEEELGKSDVFRIEGSPQIFSNVPFKKKAQELEITGIKFERISTLTS
jgi:hypothetical protein